MASANGHYNVDEKLLQSAPQLTKRDVQGGYDVNILQPPPQGNPVAPSGPPSDLEQASKRYDSVTPPASRATPFWRTTKGIILIAVVAVIVVVAAVVGGVVGGKKKHTNPNVASSPASSATPKSVLTSLPTSTGAATPAATAPNSGSTGGAQPIATGPASSAFPISIRT